MAKTTKQSTARTAGARDLSAVSATELQAELARRQKRVRTLARRHDRLLERAAALRAQIAALGGAVSVSNRKGLKSLPAAKPRNESNLIDMLKHVMGSRSMTVAEAATKVLEAGYRTTSPSFRKIVNITFARSGEFQRVGRGTYKVK